jgi:hypothetical protein
MGRATDAASRICDPKETEKRRINTAYFARGDPCRPERFAHLPGAVKPPAGDSAPTVVTAGMNLYTSLARLEKPPSAICRYSCPELHDLSTTSSAEPQRSRLPDRRPDAPLAAVLLPRSGPRRSLPQNLYLIWTIGIKSV